MLTNTNTMTNELLFFPDLILGPLVRGLIAVGIVGHGVSPLAAVQLVAGAAEVDPKVGEEALLAEALLAAEEAAEVAVEELGHVGVLGAAAVVEDRGVGGGHPRLDPLLGLLIVHVGGC